MSLDLNILFDLPLAVYFDLLNEINTFSFETGYEQKRERERERSKQDSSVGSAIARYAEGPRFESLQERG